MSAAKRGPLVRWGVSAAGAVVLVLLGLGLFHVPASVVTPRRLPPEPPIRLVPGRPDELAMRDLAPLFLPTRYNAAPMEFRHAAGEPLAPEPGRSFFDYDAVALKFDARQPVLDQPPTVALPASPVQALADMPGPLALGIGRTDARIPVMPSNGGRVDVYAAGRQDPVLGVTLPAEARPKSAGGGALAWKPLEFSAAVDAAGLVAPPVLTSGSGVEEVDNYFRNYLARTFRIGDRLAPGFYRIVIGP